jgi:hypothetical protein
MKCPSCNHKMAKRRPNIVQYYPEILTECECGTIIDEKGKDRTKEYYSDRGQWNE